MTSGHLLTDIEEDRVASALLDVDSRLETVVSAGLDATSFCRCHIDLALSTFGGFALHHNLLVRRVEVCKSIVVPEEAVAFAGQEERY